MSDPIRAMAAASLFPLDGELTLDGLTAPVTVERDAWGVPRITASSLDDLWFAQGVVTAGERLFQLELQLKLATGRLSEIFGELTYPDDVFSRTIGLNRAGATHADRVERRRPRDARGVPRRCARLDPSDARQAGRVPAARPRAGRPRRPGGVRRGDRAPGMEPVQQLGGRAAARRARRPGPPRDHRPVAALGRPGGTRLEQLGGGRIANGDRHAAARGRSTPARHPTRHLARAASARARLRRARRGAAVPARHHPRRDPASRLGRDERHGRRAGPLRGAAERRRHSGAVRGHVGAPHDPRRGDHRARRARAAHGAGSASLATGRSSPTARPARSTPSTASSTARTRFDGSGTTRRSRRRRWSPPRRLATSTSSAPRSFASRARARTSCTPMSTARSDTSAAGATRCARRATARDRYPVGTARTSGSAGSSRKSCRSSATPSAAGSRPRTTTSNRPGTRT